MKMTVHSRVAGFALLSSAFAAAYLCAGQGNLSPSTFGPTMGVATSSAPSSNAVAHAPGAIRLEVTTRPLCAAPLSGMPPRVETALYFSNGMDHVAFVQPREGKQSLIVDGRALGAVDNIDFRCFVTSASAPMDATPPVCVERKEASSSPSTTRPAVRSTPSSPTVPGTRAHLSSSRRMCCGRR